MPSHSGRANGLIVVVVVGTVVEVVVVGTDVVVTVTVVDVVKSGRFGMLPGASDV